MRNRPFRQFKPGPAEPAGETARTAAVAEVVTTVEAGAAALETYASVFDHYGTLDVLPVDEREGAAVLAAHARKGAESMVRLASSARRAFNLAPKETPR